MRFFFALVFACLASAGVRAADVEFTRVWPGWHDAEAFDRVSEYFTGKEPTGGHIIVRTHPESRGGYYFLTRVKNSGAALDGAKFSLQVIAPTDPRPKTFTFPATIGSGANVFNLGLTGAEWTDSKNPPVAWKLELLRGDGQVLASAKSFLWEKPAK